MKRRDAKGQSAGEGRDGGEAGQAGGVLDQLRGLPPPVQDPVIAARALGRARALFLRQAQPPEFPRLARLWRVYLGAEPLVAASAVVIYLGWAWGTLASLWR
jgi:hypothetical protein